MGTRRFAVALVPLAAASALGQDAPKPVPEVKAAETPRPIDFSGHEFIRKPNGMVVHYYRVNYVSADVLLKELANWTSQTAGNHAVAMEPDFPSAPISPPRQQLVPAAIQPAAASRNTLRLEDTEENMAVLLKVLDRIDVPQLQVYVEAKIAEITFSDELRLGVEAHIKRPLADTFFQGTDFRFPNRLDALNTFTTTFRDSGARYTFEYIVDLAEAGAKTTITSKPGVFVAQGETATIRVGDSEPIVEQTIASGTVSATTRFKETGLRLDVQPLLIGRDGIRARVSAELSRVSQFRVTATGTDISVVNPVIATRSADTVLTIPDGETVAIGGLDQDFDEDGSTGIPYLKDLPGIGYLFGSKTKRRVHTELVFFLTFRSLTPNEAKVVKPPSEKARSGE